MKNRNLIEGACVFLLWAFCSSGTTLAQPTLAWTAYNDHYAGQNTSEFATAWNLYDTIAGAPGASGPLRNIQTGETLPVTLSIIASGGIGQGTATGSPAPGTPSDEMFGDYIDWSGGNVPAAPLVNPGTAVDYVFTGLDASKLYDFAATSVRGGSGGSYALRWSLIEILGAVSFTPAHTTGSAVYTNDLATSQVALNSGQNGPTGDYVRWENIAPAADGSFTIRCSYYSGPIPGGTAGGPYAYGLMALRLQEFNANPTPAFIFLEPADQAVLELSRASFHAVAKGVPAPTYQWFRDNVSIPSATNDIHTLPVVHMSDNNAGFYVIASNEIGGVSCMATSRVATLTVQLDTVPPAVVNVLPPPSSTLSSLDSIEVFFSKAVTGVDASSLLVNGTAATDVEPITSSQYLFLFVQPSVGDVDVAWNPGHHIADVTSSSNRFVGEGWTYRLDTNIIYSIRINEFVAAKQRVIRDEDGDYSNWIELYNSGDVTVPLGGCYLTDDDRNLTRWQFPPVSMTPNSYLLVWASAKNRAVSTAPLHTSFKLDKDGGYLALVAHDGTNIISAFTPAYPEQRANVSYGSDRTMPAVLGYFLTPTPGAANSTAGASFGPEVRFSRNSGTFTSPFTVRLSTTSTNAVIHYSFGTNVPTASATIYTEPIPITATVRLRARTFVPGLFPGEIHSEDYILLDTSANRIPGSTNNVANFSSDLPIVVFHNYGKGAVPMSDPGMFAMIQVFEPKNGRSSLTNLPDLAAQGTIHRRGQATRWNAKASLRLETIDETGDDKNVPLLGFPADDDWVFYGVNGYDKVLMHNPLAHELYRQLGRYSSRTRFVEVFLREGTGVGPITAAHYNGLYVVEEKIKIANHRVDVDKLQPENTTAPSVTGGYLFSIDKDGPSPGLSVADSWLWNLDPDGPTLATPQRAPQLQYISDYLNAFYAALTGPNSTDPVTGYAAYIDVPAWIDYNLHQVLTFSADMLRISAFYCKPRGGKLTPAALWDFDRAFAMYSTDGDVRGFNPWRWHSGAWDKGTDPFNMDGDGGFWNPWYGRMFLDIDFFQKWIDRYQELRLSVYSSSNLTAMIDRYANEVAETTQREYARWAGYGTSDTTPNSGRLSGDGWTYTFPSPGTWAGQVKFIKTWFTNRVTFMDTNFLDMPVFDHQAGLVDAGTTVRLQPAAKSGSYVIYTLDGTDPRSPGGAVSPTASSILGPTTITIANNVRVCARSWNPNHQNLTGPDNPPLTTPWSGMTAASYYTALPSLRITEVMYHPGQPPTGNTNDQENFEYVELANIGANALELNGFQLAGGISFTFRSTNAVTSLPAGGRVLVVRDSAAFASRYPEAVNLVAGQFDRHLNNGGDHMVLLGPLGELIHDFDYDNKSYPITDGLRFSLVVLDEAARPASWTNQAQWRASAYDGGSPGAPEPATASISPIVINEVLSNPILPAADAIELWNPNATPVNIGYWYLTDNPNAPRKHLIPPDTTIQAFDYVVFEGSTTFGAAGVTNALGTLNDPFGLSSEGEEVYLFSGDSSGRLTGYFQGFDFGPTLPGVSLGRYVNSLERTVYVAQSANTFGAANVVPLVGPVVISEIMYYPPDLIVGGLPTSNARDEYIELQNISNEVVPLYDPANPANTWRIRDDISFDFPQRVQMAPGSCLLVVSFSPEADPVSLDEFRTRYALSIDVPVYGPFQGRLGNDGGRLDLRRPGLPDLVTQVPPMILSDRVDYGVASPWPATANGTGASLQRRDNTAFGNDPANWAASGPTPGGGQPLDIVVEPSPQTVVEESTAMFEVGVTGSGPFLFQWFFAGQAVAGADKAKLELMNVQLSQAGDYSVRVQSGGETIWSIAARLTVLPLPVITQQPADINANVGDEILLSVRATGTGGLSYQWQLNGANIASATRDSLSIKDAQPANSGTYRVLVSDSVGTRASRGARVSVSLLSDGLAIDLVDGSAVISWPQTTNSWTLEETARLESPIDWRPSEAKPTVVGARWQVTLPILSTTNAYYRLRRP